MTADYEGPAYKKGRLLSEQRKRKFQAGIGSHRGNDKVLEQPVFKNNQQKTLDKLDRAMVSFDNPLTMDGDEADLKPQSRPLNYQASLSKSCEQNKLFKASQAMRTPEIDKQDENKYHYTKATDVSFDTPYLQHNDFVKKLDAFEMENGQGKSYNDSLSTSKELVHPYESQSKKRDLANVEHSLNTLTRLDTGYQERQTRRYVDRELLKRLIKDKTSFLLFAKEDNDLC